MLVAADCLYYQTAEAFAKVVEAHLVRDDMVMLLCYRHRSCETLEFFERLAVRFCFERLEDRQNRAVAPATSDEDEAASVYSASDVHWQPHAPADIARVAASTAFGPHNGVRKSQIWRLSRQRRLSQET